MDEPRPSHDLLRAFLRPYKASAYSDRARLRLFVSFQLVLVALTLVMMAGNGWGGSVTLPTLVAELVFLSGVLALVLVGHSGWAEGLTALVLPLLFLFVVVTDPKVLPNPLAGDLLLVYCLFFLILITVTTSRAMWIVASGAIFLAGNLWFQLLVQAPLLGTQELNEALHPVMGRFIVLDFLSVMFLVTVQRIIHRANRLADEARSSLEDANQALKATVDAQVHKLQEAQDQVRIAHRTLSEGEKLSTVGRFIAGIAHEINTPLGAIESSALTIRLAMEALWGIFLDGETTLAPEDKFLLQEIIAAADLSGLSTSSLQRRQGRLALAALGADSTMPIPAELVDRLSEWGLLQPRPEWIKFLNSPKGPRSLEMLGRFIELNRSALIILTASGKASVYVRELRKFIAKDRSSVASSGVSVTQSLETFLLIFQNHLRGRIEVVRSYPEEDLKVLAQPDRLLQIWSNLISNAVGAMGNKGTLGLEVRGTTDSVEVRIVDDGPGIPDTIQKRIFEPFFTTKPMGEGMGLGLEIVLTIVEEHRGQITFETRPGRTVFLVTLPLWKSTSP